MVALSGAEKRSTSGRHKRRAPEMRHATNHCSPQAWDLFMQHNQQMNIKGVKHATDSE